MEWALRMRGGVGGGQCCVGERGSRGMLAYSWSVVGGVKRAGRVTTTCRVHRPNGQRVEIVNSRGEDSNRIADRSLLSSAKSFFDDFNEVPVDGGVLEVFPCKDGDGESGACYLSRSGMVFRMTLDETKDTELIDMTGKSPKEIMDELKKRLQKRNETISEAREAEKKEGGVD